MTPVLYGRTQSINVRKVCWTCGEIGLEYERVDRGGGQPDVRTPEYLDLNPNGLIPTWQDDDLTLWESNAICRYLVRKHRRTDLMPEEPVAAAYVDQWVDWAATSLNQAYVYAFGGLVRKFPGMDDQAKIAESVGKWNRVLGILDRQLEKTGAYATGSDFTLADIVLGLSVHRWKHSPIERADLPAIDAYYGRLMQRDAFKPWALPEVP